MLFDNDLLAKITQFFYYLTNKPKLVLNQNNKKIRLNDKSDKTPLN
jgi:hypothetical protein